MIETREVGEKPEIGEPQPIIRSVVPETAGVRFLRIMLATDFSPASDRAFEYALSFARCYQAKLYFTHIVSTDAFTMMVPGMATHSLKDLRLHAAQELNRRMTAERWRDVQYALAIEEGPFWPTLESLIEKFKIDLIIAGTHGKGGLRKFVLGSVAEQIFRNSPVPVLIVGPGVEGETFAESKFNNILLATDFGPGVERETACALSLCRKHGARVHLLHVLPPEGNSSEAAWEQAKESAIRKMKNLVPHESNRACWPAYWLAIGDPAEMILGMAKATCAGLIVMGAKGMRGLADRLPQNKAYQVVCGSRCPVLTVRS